MMTALRLSRFAALGGAVLTTLLLFGGILYFREALEGLGDWGYAGGFVIALANSSTVVLPSLGDIVIAGMAVVFNPWLLGLVAGFGAALGELTAYVVGASGALIMRDTRIYRLLLRIASRWGGFAVFVFAALPLPMDVAGLWAGSVRYPAWLFLAWAIPGKIIKTTALTVAAHYQLSWLLGVFGGA